MNTKDNAVYEGRIKMEVERDGKIISTHYTKNIIVDVGLHFTLDNMFGLPGGPGFTSSWYLGLLKDYTPNSSTVPADVIASANEFIAYTPTTRPAYTGVRTDKTVSNTAANAEYTITADNSDVYGAYIISTNVKNAGGSSTLLAAGRFTSPRMGLLTNDIIFVTYEISAASA